MPAAGSIVGLPIDGAQRAVALGRLDGRAGAVGDIFERTAVIVLARGSGAGRAGARGAIVLAGERNAEALLLAGLRLDRAGAGRGGGQRGKDGRGSKCIELVHGFIPHRPQGKRGGAPRGAERGATGVPACEGKRGRRGSYIEESAFPEWKTSDDRTTAGTLPWLTQ